MEIVIRGIGVSPGIAIGPALTYGVQALDIPKQAGADSRAELRRFDKAVAAVRKELQELHDRTADELGTRHADIFKAHLAILEDVTMREDITTRVETDGVNVAYAVDDLVRRYTKALDEVDDPRFRERTSDLLDVGTRILGKLLNAELQSLERLEGPCVVIAHDLSPSDTANIDTEHTLGIATDLSGPTSHTAILARALEIPAVVGLRYAGIHVVSGDTVIVDGTSGCVIIRPDENTLGQYRQEQKRLREETQALILAERERPSVTLDGHPVPTLANIELPFEISHSLKAKAEGVGLYRTEYLFLNRSAMPTEQEQFEAYVRVAEALKPFPVTLRTLDIGGDKFASHLEFAEELNPQLGWRAVRFCLERPDIFKAQLRAMLRASMHGDVRIMFPMISGLDELIQVKEVLEEVRDDLRRRKVKFKEDIPVGSMIEVPSAVTLADALAQECDFFSIGTNDLIQYSLAVDRVNEKIAHMYEPAHPAVLRMIDTTVKAAKAARIPCSICGEMAGDPLFTELLLGIGVTSLSMSAVAIPLVRAEIANTRLTRAKRFARRVLTAQSVEESKELLRRRFEGRGTAEYYLSKVESQQTAENAAPESD